LLSSFQGSFPRNLRESIGAFVFLEESVGSFDIAVCLGCTCYRRSAVTGIGMYQSGRCRKLLFTGGPNSSIGGNEAILMARLALDAGVPIADVLVDPCASNTFENCLRVKEILGCKQSSSSLAFVSIHYHSRRACETYRVVTGGSTLPAVITYPSTFYTDKDWHRSERGRQDVLGELARMEIYFNEHQCPEPRLLLNAIRAHAALMP